MSNLGAVEVFQALEDAIKRASDAGILFVAAAGNHRGNNDQQPLIQQTMRFLTWYL